MRFDYALVEFLQNIVFKYGLTLLLCDVFQGNDRLGTHWSGVADLYRQRIFRILLLMLVFFVLVHVASSLQVASLRRNQ